MTSLLNNKNVKGTIGLSGSVTEGEVKMENLRTSCLDLSFFDRLESSGIITKGGLIRQTYPENMRGIEMADLLRECLMVEESEHFELFDPLDK